MMNALIPNSILFLLNYYKYILHSQGVLDAELVHQPAEMHVFLTSTHFKRMQQQQY